mgnify:CR=1 FL=1
MENNYFFTPKSGAGSKQPKHEDMLCFGTDLRFQENYLTAINLNWLIATYNECDKKDKFFRKMFNSYEEALENYKGILKHNIHKDNFILEGYSKITGMQTIHYILNEEIKDYSFVELK